MFIDRFFFARAGALCVLLLLLIAGTGAGLLQAQNRYAVYFTDKAGSSFRLDAPEDFLSPEALQRKAHYGISIDSLDLPVSSLYLDSLKSLGTPVLLSSRWLNAAMVLVDSTAVEALEALSFIREVSLLAPGGVPASGQRLLWPEGQNARKTGLHEADPLLAPLLNTDAQLVAMQNGLLGIPVMHAEGFRGEGMRVAVFDAGFPGVLELPNLAHLGSSSRLVGTRDFVAGGRKEVFHGHPHGTQVLSLIASADEEGLLAGAPDASYVLCITEDVSSEYRIEEFNWLLAAEFADSLGVDVINSSLGYWDFDDPRMDYSISDMDGQTALVTRAAGLAAKKGILVVTSSGNYGGRGAQSITAPADAMGILSVGALTRSQERAFFSSFGPTADGRIKPDVVAIGERTALTRPGLQGSIGFGNGTSFSAPQVAALAVGLWQAYPDFTVMELIQNLQESGHLVERVSNELGFGLPNFERAYFGVITHVPVKEEVAITVYPNPVARGQRLFVRMPTDETSFLWRVWNSLGQEVLSGQVERPVEEATLQFSVDALGSGVYVLELQGTSRTVRKKFIKQ
ncbi:MAG: S8 family serine peptidase [Nitritalea sp.]